MRALDIPKISYAGVGAIHTQFCIQGRFPYRPAPELNAVGKQRPGEPRPVPVLRIRHATGARWQEAWGAAPALMLPCSPLGIITAFYNLGDIREGHAPHPH